MLGLEPGADVPSPLTTRRGRIRAILWSTGIMNQMWSYTELNVTYPAATETPEQFIQRNRSDFRGHDNFRDYGYIFTFSALTLLTCSLPVSQCHTRLGPGAELLRQQPPPFSILPGKHLKSQSWDRAVG